MIIAQITDFHIKARGRIAYRVVDTASCLAAAVATVAALDPRPDVVVGTGDLTDFGRPEEYELVAELLAPLSMPVYLVPGNHDEREAMRRAFGAQGYLPAQGPLNYTIDHHPVRMVALDTVRDGASGGLLSTERLDWLEAALGRDPDRPTCIIMHHPPFRTGIAHMDAIGLDGAAGFAEIVAKHPQVTRVLCGHLHRSIQTVVGRSAIASTAPSTAHQVCLDLRPNGPSAFVLEPPGFQIHVWDESGHCVSHTGVIGAFAGPFPFHDGGRLIDG
jgi:3',5'-cyclic AMP phosphodiesterase CpdA